MHLGDAKSSQPSFNLQCPNVRWVLGPQLFLQLKGHCCPVAADIRAAAGQAVI